MRKIYVFILCCMSLFSYAQQNSLNTSGNVGIGTVAPNTLLHIVGGHPNTKLKLTLPASSNGGNSGDVNFQAWVSEPYMTWDGGGIGMNVENTDQFPRINNSIGQSYIRFLPNGGAMRFVTTNNQGTVYPSLFMTQGNVGIGTDNPIHKLDVNGVIARTGQQILYGNPGDSYANIRVIQNNSNTVTDGMYINYNSTGGVAADLRFFANGTTERMKISANTGYVGIGTNNPLQILHVNGNEILSTGSGAGFKFRDRNSSTTDDWVWYSNENVARFFRAGFGDIMTVNTSGMMGVGAMPQAGYKFAVNGNIKAKEVKVSSLNWADFVFSPNYELPALSEVEKYIKVNKHLPEIPSEKEVKENGINLGEMNAKLLQKIEELTLYIIEEKKIREREINILKEEISHLKKEK